VGLERRGKKTIESIHRLRIRKGGALKLHSHVPGKKFRFMEKGRLFFFSPKKNEKKRLGRGVEFRKKGGGVLLHVGRKGGRKAAGFARKS